MASMPVTIASRAVIKLLDLARSLDLDPFALARESGVELAGNDLERALDPNARVAVTALHRLWTLIADHSNRRDLPLVLSTRYTIGDYGMLGYLCVNCPTLEQGLAQLVRYSRLWVDMPRMDVDGGHVTLGPPLGGGVGAWCATEAGIAEILSIVRLVVKRGLSPTRVAFRHRAPDDRKRHDEFFGCRVAFDEPTTEIAFSPEQLALPVPAADPQLGALMRELASSAVAHITASERDCMRDRVRRLLGEHLQRGQHDEHNVARMLGVSERTLRRRLREEGTSFREVLDATRSELASLYIQDTRLSLTEVAFLLGFSEASSFHRAFKRWTTATPAAFRERGAS